MKKIVFVFFIMISISSCLEGKYVEKSYTFVDFETEDGGIDGIRIRDAVSDNTRHYTYFNWGEIKFRLFYRTLEGPYAVRFDFVNNNEEIEKIIINDIILETKDIKESLLKNIWEIRFGYHGERSYDIAPEKLNEFYTTHTVEIDNHANRFIIRLSDIDISYAKIKEITLKFNIIVCFENGQIHNIDNNYTLTRFKNTFEAPYH